MVSQRRRTATCGALGVVLYEMVTGVKPLEGGIQFELGSAILGRLPSPLPAEASSVRRKVAQLGTAVERCLAKAPDARYHRASDVRGALEAVQAHADEASDSAWKYILSRKRVVGAVEAVMAEGERRIRRDRRVRAGSTQGTTRPAKWHRAPKERAAHGSGATCELKQIGRSYGAPPIRPDHGPGSRTAARVSN